MTSHHPIVSTIKTRRASPSDRTATTQANLLSRLVAGFRKRQARNRAYRDMLALSDHMLADIGLTYSQVAAASGTDREPHTLVRLNPLQAAKPR